MKYKRLGLTRLAGGTPTLLVRRSLLSLFLILLPVNVGFTQTPNWEGRWAGPVTTDVGPGALQLTLTRGADAWESSVRVRIGGPELTTTVRDLKFEGDQISFAVEADRDVIKFTGKLAGKTITGTLEAFQEGKRVGGGNFVLTRDGQMPAPAPAGGGQVADPDFNTKVANPAYKKNGPRVLFDEAHNNFHTSTGRYKPFAELVSNDGYQVIPNKEKFSAEVLKGYRVLVISNALGAAQMNNPGAADPAFSDAESDAVRDWVKAGGALLLIADHAPMGSANQILGQRFGIDMSKRYTIDPDNFDKDSGNQGFIVYSRESGRLVDHPITNGRNPGERINKIIAFTGQSLKGPPDSTSILKLADTARDVMPGPNNQPVSAAGRSQGVAMKFGKGRVLVLGEAAMMSAQLIGPQRMPFGMNRPGIDNRQFALNVMHWLTKKI